MVDLFIGAHRCNILHYYQRASFFFSCMLSSIVHFITSGLDSDGIAYIYQILNWASQMIKTGGSVLFVLIIAPIFSFFTTSGTENSLKVNTNICEPTFQNENEYGLNKFYSKTTSVLLRGC